MSISPSKQILQLSGKLIQIGNVRQLNKSTIQQSFTLEFHDNFNEIQMAKFYCKNELCDILPHLTNQPVVTVFFELAGKKTKAGNFNNNFEIINIVKH